MLDKLLKLGSISYLILTIVGIFKQAIYYQIFGLNIFDYLQLSEVLTLSINSITLYATVLVLVVAILFFFNNTNNKQDERALLAIYNLPIWWRHIGFTNKLSWAMFLSLIFFNGMFLFFERTRSYWGIFAIDIACVIFYLYLIAVVEIGRSYYFSRNKLQVKWILFAQVLGMFLFFIIIFTTHQALSIKSAKHNRPDIELYSDKIDSPILGNYLFIGKTDKYIFVYDYQEKSTIIYSSDFIKRIRFMQP